MLKARRARVPERPRALHDKRDKREKRRAFVLNERRASGMLYDSTTDVSRVFVAQPSGTVRTYTVAADLLLDAQGFLVGVDVEPGAPARTIVMLGEHEAVDRKVAARVGVCSDASGEVFEVRLAGARVAIRGHQKSPYI
jgi:hypothetical protein